MRKSFLALAVSLFAIVGSAQAANNAEITITGNVVKVTCDVNLSKTTLDLGNWAPASFTAASTPVAGSVKQFSVGLTNCAGTPTAGEKASLMVGGQTLAGHSTIFQGAAGSSSNVGVMISPVDTPTAYIATGDHILETIAGATPALGDFEGQQIILQAALAASSTPAAIGSVNAPVLFSFAYN
ncbi:fimbrial protein [Serratia fonticola]|uniref:fimbrial protein n=1 Tax=Serratia fonticola TaxID=47917 RepID=UPI003BB64783